MNAGGDPLSSRKVGDGISLLRSVRSLCKFRILGWSDSASMVSFPSSFTRKPAHKFIKFSSGLDFSDGAAPASFAVPLTPPPNQLSHVAQGVSAVRRKSGNDRLQGLLRSNTLSDREMGKVDHRNEFTRFRAWMVNEGTLHSAQFYTSDLFTFLDHCRFAEDLPRRLGRAPCASVHVWLSQLPVQRCVRSLDRSRSRC